LSLEQGSLTTAIDSSSDIVDFGSLTLEKQDALMNN